MNEVTLEKMGKLRLFGMQHSFKAMLESKTTEQFTLDQLLATLIQAEWEEQETKKIERHLRNAKFRYQATLEEINYQHDRNLEWDIKSCTKTHRNCSMRSNSLV